MSNSSSSACQTLSAAEVAKRLGVGRNQVYAAAKTGDIPSIRVGKRVLVPVAAFEQLLQCAPKAKGE